MLEFVTSRSAVMFATGVPRSPNMKTSKLSYHNEEALDPAQEFEAKLLSRNKAMHAITESGDSDIQQFYDGATVFLTGGSGFLGKQLIEKLCRATNIAKLFILLRTKKGKPIKQRLHELLQDPVYDEVRDQKPGFEQKIVLVEGDIAELRLGMSDNDWNTVTEQTDIIIHMAATTRFDEVLRVATLINVRGTRETLALGKACSKLRSFVHVSTAYSHAKDDLIKSNVLEEFYPSPVDPEAMIKMAETTDEERLNDITPSLIKGWPNTYSFAKAVAEEMVRTASDDLPICIVRPAIVVCAYREPLPGWLDMSCVYGASGIMLGPGAGVMHVVYASDETRVGLIPVDYVNNAIIASGWETARRRAEGDMKKNIYTIISSTRTEAVWGSFRNKLSKLPVESHSPTAVWYHFWIQTKYPVLFWIYSWLIHMIPAYIIDGVCMLFGKERRFVKLYTKMYKLSTSLSYFTVNHWNFEDKNLEQLYNSLSTADKEIFSFDIENMNWDEYLVTWTLGIRKYLMKDGLKGSRYAVKKQIGFKILHYIVTPLYFYLLFKVLCIGVAILSFVLRLFW